MISGIGKNQVENSLDYDKLIQAVYIEKRAKQVKPANEKWRRDR